MANILIVDAHPAVATAVAALARHAGCVPTIAHDGERGLALIRAEQFALVLLDNHMPVMSGLDVLLALKTDRAAFAPLPPIVMISSDPTCRADALRLGASDFRLKSQLGDLFDTLSRYASRGEA